jgi:hypothetical protein
MEQNLVTERLNLIQEHRGVDCFMSTSRKESIIPPLTSSANAQENGGMALDDNLRFSFTSVLS